MQIAGKQPNFALSFWLRAQPGASTRCPARQKLGEILHAPSLLKRFLHRFSLDRKGIRFLAKLFLIN